MGIPGMRFHPTDVELIKYYLRRKMMKKRLPGVISEVNIYDFVPWDLPDKACWKSSDQEWYFFCPKVKKYSSGVRAKRSTEKGYWKSTGKDRNVRQKNGGSRGETVVVGMIKTLVFHLGHAPKGERTDWIIHEYRIHQDPSLTAAGVVDLDSYVVCKLFKKSGLGPKNGEQHGAPINDEEWDDDTIAEVFLNQSSSSSSSSKLHSCVEDDHGSSSPVNPENLLCNEVVDHVPAAAAIGGGGNAINHDIFVDAHGHGGGGDDENDIFAGLEFLDEWNGHFNGGGFSDLLNCSLI
ncbi:NAC domain-containing protein 82-like [Impatiens glandulifera]|uniref:NAC domain-containing protein 82-like n=1 Tax=Impatiens glandulifera TaxID=253017 RepID=UPI001FB0558C|nr:NAC domain-containing protein 82-like [Impatiens glandulifera]